MKIVQINATCGVGSTGKICVGISEMLNSCGIENYILYSSRTNGYSQGIGCSNDRSIRLQAMKSRILGNYGFNSRRATRRMIAELDRIQPDIVHLHNIHGHDCNLEMLFTYFRKQGTKLVWTFHDCWAFTAYCPHFAMVKCGKWRYQCGNCIQCRNHSWFLDCSRTLFERKKRLLSGLNLTIATPSQWLADLVHESFLKEYPVQVVRNGIDLGIFQPCSSSFRKKYGIEEKKIILGVSFDWSVRKGLDVFSELVQRLPKDYQIVLVGTNPEVDKLLPGNIISIHRTQDQRELAEIYSSADLFLNPTREENYPTVNMESLACGTPVLTFRTGGSPEVIDATCGAVVPCDDVDAMEREILRICTHRPYPEEACLKRAESFDKNHCFKEYLDIYERIEPAGSKGY